MVCPNCQSTEVIAVQGQHFCVNCGQLIPEQAKPPKKRPVGRPRHGRLDRPRPSAAITVVAPEEPAAPPMSPPTAKPAAHVLDLRTPAPKSEDKPAHKSAKATAVATPVQPHPGLWRSSMRVLAQPSVYIQALPTALVALLPLGLVYANLFVLQTLWNNIHYRAGLYATFQLGLAIFIVVMMLLISIGAIAYGQAREHDQRGESGLVWARRSGSRIGQSLLVFLINLLIIGLAGTLITLVIIYGSQSQALPVAGQVIGTFILAVVAAYVIMGAKIASDLGIMAVVLGQLPPRLAWRLGWHGFRRHFELLAGWLAVGLNWVILIGIAGWITWWWQGSLNTSSNLAWLAAGVGTFLIALIITLQAGAASQAAYRSVVVQDHFAESGMLLLGNGSKPRSRSTIFPLILVLVIGAAIVLIQRHYIQ